MFQVKSGVALVVATITLGACASGPPDTEVSAALSAANESITHARTDNALVAAPETVNEAQRLLSQAQKAQNSGDKAQALRLANEAKVDGDLADATAQAAKAHQAAQVVNSDIGTLQQTTAPNR
jgi:acyl-CoA thioesterase